MMRHRLLLCAVVGLLTACGFTRFRGVIRIVRNQANLRVVGAFSPDGKQFAAADARLSAGRRDLSVVRIWRRGPTPDSPAKWKLVAKIGLQDLLVVDIAFSPDGRTLAIAGLGKRHSVALYDTVERRFTRLLRGSRPITQTVAFGPDGRWLISAGVDGRIRIWDVESGGERARVHERHTLLQQSRFPLAVAPDGGWLAYGRTDGRVAFADPRNGKRIAIRPSGGREILDLALSRDGRRLAVATDTGVRLLDIRKVRAPAPPAQRLSAGRAPAIAFFSDGRSLVACGELPRQARVYEVPTGRIVYGFEGASGHVRNRPLETTAPPLAVGSEEARIWNRLRAIFPAIRHRAAARSLVLGYLRFPAIHRVVVSPRDLWVAVFGGRDAHLVITQRHYRLRVAAPGATGAVPRPGRVSGSI